MAVALPESISNLLQKCIFELRPKRVVLFGSRARGDHRPDSDFDLAISLDTFGKSRWTRFLLDLEENPVTLLKVDLVDIDDVDQSYQQNINSEGVTLYEQT